MRNTFFLMFFNLLLPQRDTCLHALDTLHQRSDGLDTRIARLGTQCLKQVQQFGGICHELQVFAVYLGGDGECLHTDYRQDELRVLHLPGALRCLALHRLREGTVLLEGHREVTGLNAILRQLLL